MDETDHSMEVIAPDDHLSLAIGKRGQNVRLAAKLTGWKVDIRSETEAKKIAQSQAAIEGAEALIGIQSESEEEIKKDDEDVSSLSGIGPKTRDALKNAGINTVADIINAGIERLSTIDGIAMKKAEKILEAAQEYIKQ